MNHAEETLYNHIPDVDSLDFLIKEGFAGLAPREVIPTEIGREVVKWAIDYYFANGRKVAPSKAAILETWGDELEQLEITIDDEVEGDSVEWAVAQLRADYADRVAGEFVKRFARDVYEAPDVDKVKRVQEGAHELHQLASMLTSRRYETFAAMGIEDVLLEHEYLKEHGHSVQGLTFGLPPIDEHTFGVHPGELCILGAPAGVGKSWMAIKACLAEFLAGRRTMLVTLENDLKMTHQRMACMYARVDYTDLQRGQLDSGAIQRIELMMGRLRDSEHQPIVTMLADGERDPASIVRAAFTRGAESVIIDQLDWMEPVPNTPYREPNQIIGEQVRELRKEIREGREQIPCLLLHQINREGQERAEKTGHFRMRDFAGSSQVEKAADFLFVIYQSEDMRAAGQGQLQMLKFRRGVPLKWEVWLRYEVGDIRVIRQVTDEEED